MPFIIGGVVAVLIAGFAGFIATRPGRFTIQRSAEIGAPPATVYALISSFRNWVHWSPWEKLDPNLQREYSGPDAGVRAGYHWVGNQQVGEGRMTILETRPDEEIVIRLEFIKPFSTTNQTTFRLAPDAGRTRVDWIMEGQHNFMGKAFSLMMNMDKMVGKDFEQGLANLDAAARQDLPR
jgi:hypothetical protein